MPYIIASMFLGTISYVAFCGVVALSRNFIQRLRARVAKRNEDSIVDAIVRPIN